MSNLRSFLVDKKFLDRLQLIASKKNCELIDIWNAGKISEERQNKILKSFFNSREQVCLSATEIQSIANFLELDSFVFFFRRQF